MGFLFRKEPAVGPRVPSIAQKKRPIVVSVGNLLDPQWMGAVESLDLTLTVGGREALAGRSQGCDQKQQEEHGVSHRQKIALPWEIC